MVFGIGIMLIILGVLQAMGVGARIKNNGLPVSKANEDLAVMGKIIFTILIVAAGICLLCV